MSSRRSPMELVDYIAELTRPYVHREHYSTTIGLTNFNLDHVTHVPSLLDQLQFASPSGSGLERGAGGYESRPAASVASVGTYLDIDRDASRWVRDLGEDDAGDAAACVRRLNVLALQFEACRTRHQGCDPGCIKPHRGCCTRHDLERDVRSWWVTARIVTGWDEGPWRPNNTCPMCGDRGTLRIRLNDRIALCSECRETWDPATIGLLAEHIRAEAAGERRVPLAVFCWCPWPQPAYDAWPSLCTVCGSPWCHRAVARARELSSTPEHPWVAEAKNERMGA